MAQGVAGSHPDATLSELCEAGPLHAEFVRAFAQGLNDPAWRDVPAAAFLASAAAVELQSRLQSATRLADPSFFCRSAIFASGADGVVYLALHVETGQPFALKRQRIGKLHTKDHLSREWLEHRILTTVRSPFLIDAAYAFLEKRHSVLATRFMPGGTLSSYVGKQSSGSGLGTAARFYIASVVLGLETLHAQQIVYRDLKGANILLDARGYARIADFGMCFQLSEGRFAVGTAGTVGHIAPEQYASRKKQGDGQRDGYGKSVDLWALGTLVYHWTTGKRPFRKVGESTSSSMVKKLVKKGTFDTSIEPLRSNADVKSFACGLLTVNPAERLGTSGGGVKSLESHAYFAAFDWEELRLGRMEAPITPAPFSMPKKREVHRAEKLVEEAEPANLPEASRTRWNFVDATQIEEGYAIHHAHQSSATPSASPWLGAGGDALDNYAVQSGAGCCVLM